MADLWTVILLAEYVSECLLIANAFFGFNGCTYNIPYNGQTVES